MSVIQNSNLSFWNLKKHILYFLSNDMMFFFTPMLLVILWSSFLLMLNHSFALTTDVWIVFLAFFGLIALFNVMYLVKDDDQDGTIDYFASTYNSLSVYLISRITAMIVVFYVPLFVLYVVIFVILDFSYLLFYALVFYSIQMLLSMVTAQLIASVGDKRCFGMNELLLVIPSWIPSFLYLIGLVSSPEDYFIMLALCLCQLGVLLIVSFFVRKWN